MANVIKLFTALNYDFFIKSYLWVKPGAYPRVELLKGASIG
jgi:hypothetical protein